MGIHWDTLHTQTVRFYRQFIHIYGVYKSITKVSDL